jgi:hypothetical protein
MQECLGGAYDFNWIYSRSVEHGPLCPIRMDVVSGSPRLGTNWPFRNAT